MGADEIIWPSLLTVKSAELAPKVTLKAVVKPLPLIITMLPPAIGPALGSMVVIVGTGA